MVQKVTSRRESPIASRGTEQDSGRAVQLKAQARGLDFAAGSALMNPEAPVQMRGGEASPGQTDIQGVAERGVASASSALPHQEAIQRSFGRHDVSGIGAQVGGSAGEATRAIGASAYATGDKVAFGSSPDLHTAAHEAAHVVQQRQGVQLKGGVGQAGDPYERHADAVADAVVQGRSAEGLLDQHKGGGGHGVQAYGGRTTDYTTQADQGSQLPMFENELADPQLKGDDDKTKIAYSRETQAHPKMRFSDDNTLGIEASKRVDPLKGGEKELAHAKDLYLTDTQLADANQRLSQSGGMVRLTPTGHQITKGGTALLGVKPGIAGEQSALVAQRMVDLRTDVCIDLATSVMSGNPVRSGMHAKLGAPGEEKLARITNTDTESPEVSQLGQHLGSGGSGDVEQARAQMPGGPKLTPGKAYGGKIHRDELGAQTSELGINEHAKPEVGEGYATYTMGGTGNDAKMDYTELGEDHPQERDAIWGYHYAGVVAKSADGRDSATLENYNRRGDMLDAKKHLLAKLKRDFGQELDEIQALGKDDKAGPTDQRLRQAYAKIEAIGRNNGRSAAEMFLRATSVQNSGAWFFAMYGSNPGQSFHEQNAQSGYFANPLTVRVSNEVSKKLEQFRHQFGPSAPAAPDVLANHPAFNHVGAWRDSVRTTIEKEVKTVDELPQVVARAMDTFRDQVRQAIWTAMGDLLEHTGVHLPPAIPPDFTGLRGALGDLAGRLDQKNNRLFTRETSNDRRSSAITACHKSADYLIKVDNWLRNMQALVV